MEMEMIGRQIAALRKEKGVRQEDLASYVGVSAQAVSKWENGGVPDTLLLPRIADFFEVTVDRLFGRTQTEGNVHTALRQSIAGKPEKERIRAAFEYCWDLEKALFGHTGDDRLPVVNGAKQSYSSVMHNEGFTRMGLGRQLRYFLLVPDCENSHAALLENVDYPSFFRDMADEKVFDACVMLHKRDSGKAFTEMLLMKSLNIEQERALQVLDVLCKYGLVTKTLIETDEERQTVYHFRATPSFAAFLIFSREMICPPNHFHYYMGHREKPYL